MRVKFSLNHCQSGETKFYLTNYYLFDFMDFGCLMSQRFKCHASAAPNKFIHYNNSFWRDCSYLASC